VSEVSPTGQAGTQPDGPWQPEPARHAGGDRFDAQRAALAGLADRPLSEHADVFGQVHAQLQAALADIDGI
jgi:hypothetical protein